MATIIGLDGNDAPALTERGVRSIDDYGLEARGQTALGQEPYKPDYGVAFRRALGQNVPTAADLRERLRRSLRLEPTLTVPIEDLTVRISDNRIQILIDLGRST